MSDILVPDALTFLEVLLNLSSYHLIIFLDGMV